MHMLLNKVIWLEHAQDRHPLLSVSSSETVCYASLKLFSCSNSMHFSCLHRNPSPSPVVVTHQGRGMGWIRFWFRERSTHSLNTSLMERKSKKQHKRIEFQKKRENKRTRDWVCEAEMSHKNWSSNSVDSIVYTAFPGGKLWKTKWRKWWWKVKTIIKKSWRHPYKEWNRKTEIKWTQNKQEVKPRQTIQDIVDQNKKTWLKNRLHMNHETKLTEINWNNRNVRRE